MEELENASGLRLWDTGTPRGSRSSSQALLGYLRTFGRPPIGYLYVILMSRACCRLSPTTVHSPLDVLDSSSSMKCD